MTFRERVYVWVAGIAAALVGGTVVYELAKPSSSGGGGGWTKMNSAPPAAAVAAMQLFQATMSGSGWLAPGSSAPAAVQQPPVAGANGPVMGGDGHWYAIAGSASAPVAVWYVV